MKKSVLISLILLGLVCGVTYAQHSETKRGANGHPLGCVPSSTEASENQAVFQQLNQYRQAQGRGALAYDGLLEQCIEGHCHHMSMHPFFAHNAPESDMADPWIRARANGTTATGENIARGQRGATAVMNSWKGSPGHNANMLNGNHTRVGCGYYATGGPYWGQLFGSGAATPPTQQPPPPAGGGGGGNPGTLPGGGAGTTPPSGGGGGTPTTDPPATGGGPAPAPNDPPPAASSQRQYVPPPKKIVPAGMLK